MSVVRFLLPFTQGIDSQALATAVMLAQEHNATLVALSFMSDLEKDKGNAQIATQSTRFLVLLKSMATTYAVSAEFFETASCDPAESITSFAQDMQCDGILLFACAGSGILLRMNEVKRIMQWEQGTLYLFHLRYNNNRKLARETIFLSFSRWLFGYYKQQIELLEIQNCPRHMDQCATRKPILRGYDSQIQRRQRPSNQDFIHVSKGEHHE